MFQHINRTAACREAQIKEVSAKKPTKHSQRRPYDEQDRDGIEQGRNRRSKRLKFLQQAALDKTLMLKQFAAGIGGIFVAEEEADDADLEDDDGFPAETDGTLETDDADDEEDDEEEDEIASNGDESMDAVSTSANTEMLQQFREYCNTHDHRFLPLSKEDIASIKLMDVLRRKKAPLNAYAEVLEWHLKQSGELREHESLKDTSKYHHRKTLMKKLIPRYNLEAMMPKIRKVRLPNSKALVQIPYRDVKDCIVSLLTDPRFDPKDYLFTKNNPFAPPPEQVTYLEDLNTGDAYLKTYEELITRPNQVLLMVVFYIDGATTGQFSDLPVTALKISLGIHTRKVRQEEKAWREVAWIPQVRKANSRGKKLFKESGHLDSQDIVVLDGEGDTDSEKEDEDEEGEVSDPESDDKDTDVKAQDMHKMLAAALHEFVNLQKTGFMFDLVHNRKLFRDAEIIPVVSHVKCDTKEGDMLCGKYESRTKLVKHVCRYCHCPMDDADNPLANYPLKTQAKIQSLVEKEKLEQLQEISQHYIRNAWYKVAFHRGNTMGIHGACPSDKLHAVLLGVFKYLKSIFLWYMGKQSILADNINGLAKMYGKFFTRQSERRLPVTNFSKGLETGKLMATHHRGMLLIMAAVLRSTLGRKLLLKRRKMGGNNGLRDWSLLVEQLLEWEAYLCERKMLKKDVKKLARKHRFIMYLMKNVAQRTEGMGLKIMKFHAIIHMVQDMLLYGVPYEFDTGDCESNHKPTKAAAKMTQRKESTFHYQTATRMTEFLAIDLALAEILENRCVWKYFSYDDVWDPELLEELFNEYLDQESEHDDGDSGSHDEDLYASDNESETEDNESEIEVPDPAPKNANLGASKIRTGGTRIKIFENEDKDNEPSFEVLGRGKASKTQWLMDIVVFLNDLQNLVMEFIPQRNLPVYTEHQRDEFMFRAHPNYRGDGPWKDWVLVDWGQGEGKLPCHIWCFIVLQDLPKNDPNLEFGGIELKDGTYAVVECAEYVEEETEVTQSDLFTPLELITQGMDDDGDVIGRQFYLADVDAFAGPCCVIPDVGGECNAYFQVKNRDEWSGLFQEWLKIPHAMDEMDISDDEE